jgi:hypothetical protein
MTVTVNPSLFVRVQYDGVAPLIDIGRYLTNPPTQDELNTEAETGVHVPCPAIRTYGVYMSLEELDALIEKLPAIRSRYQFALDVSEKKGSMIHERLRFLRDTEHMREERFQLEKRRFQ